jgi:hypothetical protein
MGDQLARLGAAAGIAHAIDDVIQARFEYLQQGKTRQAGRFNRLAVIAPELAFKNAIHPPRFLLGAQLGAKVGFVPAAPLALTAMLAGGIGAPVNRAFWGKAALALEEKFFSLTAA